MVSDHEAVPARAFFGNHERYSDIATIHDPDGPIETTTRQALAQMGAIFETLRVDDWPVEVLRAPRSGLEIVPFCGHYGFVNGRLLAFFRWDGRLFLRRDRERLEITSDMSSCLSEKGATRELRITRGGQDVFSIKYPTPVIDPPLDPLRDAFDEEEFYDLCMFVGNVVNDKVRLQGIYPGGRSKPVFSQDHPAPPFAPHGFRLWATCLILPLGGWALEVWPFMPGLPTAYGILSIILVALGAGLALVPVPGIWMASDIMCVGAFITGAAGFAQALRGGAAGRRGRFVLSVVGLLAAVVLVVGNHL